MKKKPNHKYFVEMTIFLMGRYGFDKPLEVVKDNRLDCPCCVDNWDDTEKIKVKYNAKILKGYDTPYLLNFILHEIGHLINDLPYTTDDEIIISERQAEKFSLKTMKKEYNKDYKLLLKIFKSTKALKSYFQDEKIRSPYYWAYKKIKEYKENTTEEDRLWLQKEEKKLKKIKKN